MAENSGRDPFFYPRGVRRTSVGGGGGTICDTSSGGNSGIVGSTDILPPAGGSSPHYHHSRSNSNSGSSGSYNNYNTSTSYNSNSYNNNNYKRQLSNSHSSASNATYSTNPNPTHTRALSNNKSSNSSTRSVSRTSRACSATSNNNNNNNNINSSSSSSNNNPTSSGSGVSSSRNPASAAIQTSRSIQSNACTFNSQSAHSTPVRSYSTRSSRIMKTRKYISEEDVIDRRAQQQASNSKYNAAGQLIPRRMLIAVDESDNSERAFDWYMNNLRDDKRDLLVLLHVSNSGLTMPIHAGVDIPQRSFDAFNSARRSSTSQVVTDVIELYEDKARDAGLESSAYEMIHINESNAGKAICKYAKNNNIDHVILGTRGFSKLRRKLLGSVSDYVLNNCVVSTTIVRQPPEDK